MVTVIARTSTEADAADTALCVMDDESALQLAARLGTIDVRLATVTSTVISDPAQRTLGVRMTPGFLDRLAR
jgi:thiamine biosynthesis lipoprotein ApbE